MLERYKPSGAVAPLTPVFILPLAIAGAVLGAADGAVSFFLSRYPFMTLLLPVLLAAGVFFAVRAIVGWSHCRNVGVGMMLGGLAALATLAAAHVTLYELDAWSAVSPPAGFLDFLRLRVTQGWTPAKPSTTLAMGITVALFWGFEGVCVVAGGVAGGAMASARPYCEGCGRWVTRVAHRFALPGLPPPGVAAIRKAETLEALLDPPLAGMTASTTAVEYVLRDCAGCGRSAALTVSVRESAFDAKGKEKVELTPLHEGVVVPPEKVPAVARLGERAAAARGAGPASPRGGRRV